MADDVLERWAPHIEYCRRCNGAVIRGRIADLETRCVTDLAGALAATRAECEALRQQIRMLEAQDDDDEVRRRLRQYEGTEIELAECRAECGALRQAATVWVIEYGDYDGIEIAAIFATKDAAEACLERTKDDRWWQRCTIRAYPVYSRVEDALRAALGEGQDAEVAQGY